MRIPDDWVNPPVLPLHLKWIGDAYYELSTCRPSGFGVSSIPWDKIKEYAEEWGLDETSSNYFRQVIRNVDNAVVKYFREKEDNKDN